MAKNLLFVFLFVLILGACSGDELPVTPTEIALLPTRNVPATAVPTNTQTAVPTPSSTSAPTDTPPPTATATITPTPTPTAAIWVESGTPISQSEVIGLENVTQITELVRWGRGVIRDIDLSADGRWLAVAAGSGAYIHDLQDFEVEPLAFETGGDVTAVSISPTGDRVALVAENQLQLWQVDPVKRLFVTDDAKQIQFSVDDKILVVTKEIRTDHANVRSVHEFLDAHNGDLISSYPARYNSNIKLSPNEPQAAFWSQYSDSVSVKFLGEDPRNYVNKAILQSDLGGDVGAMIGDIAFVNEDEILLLVIEIIGNTILTGRIEVQQGIDNTVLFSVDSIGYSFASLEKACNDADHWADPPDPIIPNQMEVSADLQIIALKYLGGSLRFHRVADGEQPYFIQKGVADFEFSPDGQTWVVGLNDGRLQVRRLSDGAVVESVDVYESPILDTIVSADDAWVGVVYVDEVKVYQRATGNLQYRYPAATKIAFAPDSESFTLAYQDGLLELHDINNGELVKTIAGHDDRVTAIDYLPTGELLSAGADCKIMMWEMPEMLPIDSLETILVEPTIPEDTEEEKVAVHIQDFLVMLDGQSVIGQFYDFGIWNMEDNQLIREPSSDYQEYSEILAVSLDGKTLAVPQHRIPESWDDTLTFVETDANEAGLSPDASLLVGDPWLYAEEYEFGGMLNVWQVEPKQLLATVGEETEPVTAVHFTKDGQLIISSARDGIVRLWGIP